MSMCTKCWGTSKIVFGALLLLNAFIWPKWMGIDGWVSWLAVLMVVAGFVRLVAPRCKSCEAPPATKKKK